MKAMLALLLTVVVVQPLCGKAVAQNNDSAFARPALVSINSFGFSGASAQPTDITLTDAQESSLEAEVAHLPQFPPYLYSGCDDRAHAEFMLLSATAKELVNKVWIVAPSKLTVALTGTIKSADLDPAHKAVDWGYHVALEYRSSSGYKIIDPALNPGQIVAEDKWFNEMSIAAGSIWMRTSASVYKFNYSTNIPFATNSQVWNGGYFRYTGTTEGSSLHDNWIPVALARDAIGADAISHLSCQRYQNLAIKPDDLQTDLKNADQGNAGDPCKESVDKFNVEKAKWVALLNQTSGQ